MRLAGRWKPLVMALALLASRLESASAQPVIPNPRGFCGVRDLLFGLCESSHRGRQENHDLVDFGLVG